MGIVTLLLVSGSTSHMVMDCAACAESELERRRKITNIERPSLEYRRFRENEEVRHEGRFQMRWLGKTRDKGSRQIYFHIDRGSRLQIRVRAIITLEISCLAL